MLVYTGPTGVGKTALIDAVAQAVPAEIINIDMGQFYTPLNIGTAKPDWQSAQVPHHMFDLIDQPRDFTVAHYRSQLIAVIDGVWSRKRIPILVGGSGFYVRSLFFPPVQTAAVSQAYSQIPQEQLWEHLRAIDSERAAVLEKKDYYRIERALDIWYAAGKKPSELQPSFNPPCSFGLIGVMRDREDLYARIDQRVALMMHDGWIKEVVGLQGSVWEQFLLDKKLIGYVDIFNYLAREDGDMDLLIDVIAQKTRNYAKRQMTFWRGLKRQIDTALQVAPSVGPMPSFTDEINLTLMGIDVYIKRLVVALHPVLKEL
ncbi:MAG: tRNA (adenosine(37)-N6)-dimethylallyltransferase MiaA [Candidatus Babeliales bacterium]